MGGGGSGNADVIIKIQAQVENIAKAKSTMQDQIRKLTNDYQKQTAAIKKQMAEIRAAKDSAFEGGREGKRDALAQKRVQLAQLKEDYTKAYATMNNRAAGFNKQLVKQRKVLKQVRGEVRKTKNEFPSWALSLMFFGQLITQTMMGIWRNSVRTFQDIAHSIRGTVTGFDRLQASLTYLGFVVGQALEPIAAFLAPIIMNIANWVNENEKLVRTLFVTLSIIGGILTFVGLLGLSINALKTGFIALAAPIKGVGSAIAAIGLGKVIVIILAIVAVLVVLREAWKSNFGGIQEFTKETLGILWSMIVGVFDGIKQMLGGFIKVIRGIFTGDFELIIDGVLDIIEGAIKVIVNILAGLLSAIYNVQVFIHNIVVDLGKAIIKIAIGIAERIARAFVTTIEGIIDFVNNLIKILNSIPFVNIPPIDAKPHLKAFNNMIDATSKTLKAGVDSFSETFKRDFVQKDTVDNIKDKILDGVSWVRDKIQGERPVTIDVEVDDSDVKSNPLLDRIAEMRETNPLFSGDFTSIMDLPEVEMHDDRVILQGDINIENNIEEMPSFDEIQSQIDEILNGFKEYKA